MLGKLRRRWSPEQISNWLADQFPGHPELQVSHETIYQALYVRSRGNLRRELTNRVALRQGRRTRRPHAAIAGAVRSARPWATGFRISNRPVEVQGRLTPGHWEGDLVLGANGASAIITVVERRSRYVMLGHLPATRDSRTVMAVLTMLARRIPAGHFQTLTWD